MVPVSDGSRYGLALTYRRGFLRWETIYGHPCICRDCMGAVMAAVRGACPGAVTMVPLREVSMLGERHLDLTQALSLKGSCLGVSST